MILYKYILLIIIVLLSYSCGNKQKSNYLATKDSIAQSQAIGEAADSNQSQQQHLFEQMAKSMLSNDASTFKKDLDLFNNIDTLMPYKIDENDEQISYSLLGLACRLNSLEIVKELVARGANIEIGSEDEYYAQDALYHTIVGGNVEIINILLKKGANVNAIYSETGLTPLGLCVIHKKYLMAEILLKNGAKVDGVGDIGFDHIWYPIHDAILEKDAEMVKLLLKYKADITLSDAEGVDALELAKSAKATEILEILRKHK